MTRYAVDHLPDRALLREAIELAADGRRNTAELLARLALIDERELYLPAGFKSMHAWCIGKLAFSDDSADKRIHAARTARKFPALFEAVADGRLHLTAVGMLATHLTAAHADELIALAARKPKDQLARLLAERFPRPEAAAPPLLAASPCGEDEPALERVNLTNPAHSQSQGESSAAESRAVVPEPAWAEPCRTWAQVTPLSAERFRLEGTIDRETDALLSEARELLGHAVPGGNLAQVLQYCVKATVTQLRRRKFGAARCGQAGKAPRASVAGGRRIPAGVRRAVRERDGGMCAFVGTDGHRCCSRERLEYDHIIPVARGGQSTVDNLRLLCRAHNQYAAAREFGKSHVAAKREAAQRRRAEERIRKQAELARTEVRRAELAEQNEELGGALRNLGYRGEPLRRALVYCAAKAGSPPEERLKYALGCMAPAVRRDFPAPRQAARETPGGAPPTG